MSVPDSRRSAAHRLILGLVLCGGVSCLPSDGTGTDDRRLLAESCAADPLPPAVVFVDAPSESLSRRFAGIVATVSGPDGLGIRRIELAGEDPPPRIALRAGVQPPPLEAGVRYRFQVDQAGEVPKTGGILVWDDEGLRFAAASDLEVGASVLRDGVPGFELVLAPADCASRPSGECFDAIVNRVLQVRHAGESVALFHGDIARLGAYEIRCLIAQQAISNARCADAALHGVSYVITRQD